MFRIIFGFNLIVVLLAFPCFSVSAQQDTPSETPNSTPTEVLTIVPSSTSLPGMETQPVFIKSPQPGQALQGIITIIGNIPADSFQNAELSFSYINNPTNTWFLIQSINEHVDNGTIAEWDTTTITDGTYHLRLTILTEDSKPIVIEVSNLRVRNYTPIETHTPTPVTPTATPVPGASPTPTESPIPPSTTPLPKNPAQLSTGDITLGFGKGILATIGVFALIGLYVVVRKIFAHR